MNDIINEFGYLKPGTSLEKEDSIRLLKVKPRYSGKDASDDEFFNTWGFTKDNSDVADYFNSYLDSPGFKRIIKNQNEWWESRHPYRKYYSNPDLGTQKWFNIAKRVEPNRYINKMSTVYSESIQDPTEQQRFIIVGSHPTPYWVLPDYPEKLQHHPIAVLGHEYAHGKAPFSLFGATHFNPKSAQAEALDQNTNTKPGHDSRQLEKHADLWGLKYLLYKEGIYDSRSNKDITEEEIQKLRKKYPNLRPLKQMTDKQLMFMLNHVAMNNVNTDRPLMAKKGNKLITKHQNVNRLDIKGLQSDPEFKRDYNLYINPDNIAIINDSLINRGANNAQIGAALTQIISESGGDTEPHGNGAYGLVGWRGSRAENLPKDLPGQTHKLMVEIFENHKDWTDGGPGMNINTGKEMQEFFKSGAYNNYRKANNALMNGYVRPPLDQRDKRSKLVQIIKKYIK